MQRPDGRCVIFKLRVYPHDKRGAGPDAQTEQRGVLRSVRRRCAMGRVGRCSTQRAGCLDGRYARCSRYGLRGLIATGTDVLTRTRGNTGCANGSASILVPRALLWWLRAMQCAATHYMALSRSPLDLIVRNFTYDVVRG